ncbi:MAG: hypothetical protein F4Z49_07290, partial [Gemmatimonadetes bacterium]|nr:hypothetical protein [Gemmatimonadota bacterium]
MTGLVSYRMLPAVCSAVVILAACGKDSPTASSPNSSQSTERVPTRINVAPTDTTFIAFGSRVQMQSTVVDQNNRSIQNASVTWSSSDNTVVSVLPSGLATAVGNGTAQVRARYLGLTAAAAITVRQVPSAVRIQPSSVVLMSIRDYIQLSARVIDFRNNDIRDAVVSWQSGNTAVATVSASGRVTAVSPGETTITAMSGRVSGQAQVTVQDSGPQPSTDRDVLVAFYNATGGPQWTDNTNWLSERPVGEWYGVTVDHSGSVTQLSLPGNNLRGGLPSVLGELTKLTRLELWHNRLSGVIPVELGRLSELRTLALQINRLTGNIPEVVGRLTNLRTLALGDNELTGPIPPSLGDLTQLTVLLLNDSRLSGMIPSELGKLTNLIDLGLDTNQLTGEIPPSLGNLVQLNRLQLQDNRLAGPIPLG